MDSANTKVTTVDEIQLPKKAWSKPVFEVLSKGIVAGGTAHYVAEGGSGTYANGFS